MNKKTKNSHNASYIAYLTLLGAIIAYNMNSLPKDEFNRFHIRQAFGIHITFHAMAILVSNYLDLTAFGLIWLLYLLLWGHGFWGAIQGKKNLTPIVGHYFQKWFTFVN